MNPNGKERVARTVFVTGGTGYIGRRLIDALVSPEMHVKTHVRALVRDPDGARLPREVELVRGDALDPGSFAEHVRGCDTFVQLVGVPRPSPWKAQQFRAIDRVSALASLDAARSAHIQHFVYLSVAQPAPVMRAYIAVREECEAAICASGIPATFVRPWYVLGPGHRWPLMLTPMYALLRAIPSTRDSAERLGLVRIDEVVKTLVWTIANPPTAEGRDGICRMIDTKRMHELGASVAFDSFPRA